MTARTIIAVAIAVPIALTAAVMFETKITAYNLAVLQETMQ